MTRKKTLLHKKGTEFISEYDGILYTLESPIYKGDVHCMVSFTDELGRAQLYHYMATDNITLYDPSVHTREMLLEKTIERLGRRLLAIEEWARSLRGF